MTTKSVPAVAGIPVAPTAAEQWQAEVLYLLGELTGGTIRKLDTLMSNPPTGVEVFPALAAVLQALGVADEVLPANRDREVNATRPDVLAARVAELERLVKPANS